MFAYAIAEGWRGKRFAGMPACAQSETSTVQMSTGLRRGEQHRNLPTLQPSEALV